MIWILLAALGVSLWAIAAGILFVVWSRRRLRQTPGVFACHVRPAGPAETSDGWPRAKRYAYWVHDVLLVHHGPALLRYDALAVASVVGPSAATAAKGLGDQPMWLRLHLDDGRLLDVVARDHDLSTASGPFVTAPML
jgi:hypothetical protein